MAESVIVKNFRSGLIELISGANSYPIKFEQGTFTLNVPGPTIAVYLDRGQFADTLHGQPNVQYDQDQPMTGSFTCYLRDFSDGSYITAPQFIFKSGQFLSSWGTTLVGAGTNAPKLCDLKWTVAGILHGDSADHTALLQWVNITGAVAEGSPNMVTLNYTSYDLYPTVT